MSTNKEVIRSLLGSKAWLTIQAANQISRFGDSVDAIAFSWLVYTLTGSPLLMGLLFAVNALPNLIFAPFSGVFADHFRKKPIIVLAHAGRGILVAGIALLHIGGGLQPWMLFVFTFLSSTLETFAVPAHGSLSALIVDRDLQADAQGLAGSASTITQLAGLGAAGIIIAGAGTGGALLLDAATFFIAAVLTWTCPIQGDSGRSGQLTLGVWWNDFTEGLRFMGGKGPLLLAMFLAMFANFALAPLNVLEAAYVKDILHAGPEGLSWIGSAILVGMAAGGLLAGAAARKWGTWPVVFTAFAGAGLGYALIGLAGLLPPLLPPLAMAVLAYLMTGFTIPFINAPLFGWLSATIDPAVQGRVFAALNALCLMASPLGSSLSGAAAALLPIPWLFVIMGSLIIAVSLGSRVLNDRRQAAADPVGVVEEAPPS